VTKRILPLGLALAPACAAPGSAAVKANPATFTDPTGDAGTAADVGSVVGTARSSRG